MRPRYCSCSSCSQLLIAHLSSGITQKRERTWIFIPFLGRGRVAARGLYRRRVSEWVTEWVSDWNFLQIFYKFSKLNFSGFRPPNQLKFFFLAPCVSPLRGWQHATCPTCTWTRARGVLWRHVPKKVKKPNFLNFCRRKKLNTKIWGRRKF